VLRLQSEKGAREAIGRVVRVDEQHPPEEHRGRLAAHGIDRVVERVPVSGEGVSEKDCEKEREGCGRKPPTPRAAQQSERALAAVVARRCYVGGSVVRRAGGVNRR
jgi:hypothetical protein